MSLGLTINQDWEKQLVRRETIEWCKNQYEKEVLGKMTTLKEEAKVYEPQLTKNIADLPEVSVEFELEDKAGTDKEGKEFKYKVINVNGEDYRVPGSVIGSLKSILEKKPDLKTFSVAKKGEGFNTTYTVIPM